MDFCRLNTHMKKDLYPLPWIQEALGSKAGVRPHAEHLRGTELDILHHLLGCDSVQVFRRGAFGALMHHV